MIDMYGEKVAEASALIREFAHTEYYHYFAINMEASLEAFIAMMDSCREEGRVKGRGEAMAELQPHWLGQKERADQLQAQLEEAETLIAQTSHGAAERISELEAQVAELLDADKPIPCSERTPELGDYSVLAYFALCGGWDMVHVQEYFGPITNGYDAEGNQQYTQWYISQGVTHWKMYPNPPLPAAPSTVEG